MLEVAAVQESLPREQVAYALGGVFEARSAALQDAWPSVRLPLVRDAGTHEP
jgi:hypothetical protein